MTTMLKLILGIILAVLLIALTTRLLIWKKHGPYVHALWLAFSAAFMTVLFVAIGLDLTDTVLPNGELPAQWADHVTMAGHFFLDLGTELVYLAIFVLFPFSIQIAAYLASAPAGCATKLYGTNETVSFATLFFIKSIAGAAGFLAGIVCVSLFLPWVGLTWLQRIALLMLSAIAQAEAFAAVLGYLHISELIAKGTSFMPAPIKRLISWVHRQATRNRSEDDGVFWKAEKAFVDFFARRGIRSEICKYPSATQKNSACAIADKKENQAAMDHDRL